MRLDFLKECKCSSYWKDWVFFSKKPLIVTKTFSFQENLYSNNLKREFPAFCTIFGINRDPYLPTNVRDSIFCVWIGVVCDNLRRFKDVIFHRILFSSGGVVAAAKKRPILWRIVKFLNSDLLINLVAASKLLIITVSSFLNVFSWGFTVE